MKYIQLFYSLIISAILNGGRTTGSTPGCAVNKDISLRIYGITMATAFCWIIASSAFPSYAKKPDLSYY